MIICCGEALIDMIPADGAFTPHAGGAIFNTAIALGRLGVEAGFVSGLSTDLFGTMLRDGLVASHVNCDHVVWSDRPTTLAFVELTDGHATYTFYDENTAGRMLSPDALPDLPETVKTLQFGGISLISEPCAEFYAALALREAPARVIYLDPNIRTGFIRDEARYRARLDRLIPQVDVLKVSDEDLHWLVPGDAPLTDKARSLRARGPAIVILTRGGDGAAAFYGADQMTEVGVPLVIVADTVGAGDTFNAGFLANLSRDGLLDKGALRQIDTAQVSAALDLGAAVAAVTVSRPGANPPWAHEIPDP